MKAKDANLLLGDLIVIYSNSSGYIDTQISNLTYEATVIGISRYKYGYILGWKDQEDKPRSASRRNEMRAETTDYITNNEEYTYSSYITLNYEIDLVKKKSEPIIQIENTKIMDLSDWKTWRSAAPGDCFCGIPKTNCEYHK